MERLEGDGTLLSVLVLVEFPSLEHAKAWYNDPEYAPMITLRQTGADANIVVVSGLYMVSASRLCLFEYVELSRRGVQSSRPANVCPVGGFSRYLHVMLP